MKKLYLHSFKTERGLLRTAATEKGLALVALPGDSRDWFGGRIEKYFSNWEIVHGGEINKQAEKELAAFLAGKIKKFTVALDIQATPFQRKVLKRVSQIPYGQTMTYGQVAAAVGSPRAARAVGTANARNNLPLIIPCHRVVASNGIGGYGGSEELKRKLLEMEGAI